MKPLFQIAATIRRCFRVDESHIVDGETGEIFDSAYLDNLHMEKEKKVDNIACWAKELRMESRNCRDVAETYAKRARQAEKKADALEDYLTTWIPGEKMDTKRCQIRWRRSEKVTITDEKEIPNSYIKVKEVRSVDKAEIRKQLKEGLTIPGTELTECQNIQIK